MRDEIIDTHPSSFFPHPFYCLFIFPSLFQSITKRELENCLHMVFASQSPFEIIAVDDCSSDATPQILARQTDPALARDLT